MAILDNIRPCCHLGPKEDASTGLPQVCAEYGKELPHHTMKDRVGDGNAKTNVPSYANSLTFCFL